MLRSCGNLLELAGYEVKVIDLINPNASMCYNPFSYLRDDADVQRLVTGLFDSTKGKTNSSADPFWDNTAAILLKALILYLFYEAEPEEQNFSTVLYMTRAAEASEERENFHSPLDKLFLRLQVKNPNHIAVRYYEEFRKSAGKTMKSILITLLSKLEKFNLAPLDKLTRTDEMDLGSIGEKKTALFIVIPDNDTSFNFLVALLYTQLFQVLEYKADFEYGGRLPVPVQIIMDEFANVAVPPLFVNYLATMRSRGVSVSIIIQNMAQLKKMFDKEWESVVGNCDEFLYLGGNEQSTHEFISKMLGKQTISVKTQSRSKGRNGHASTSIAISGRELLTPDEVRMLDNSCAMLFIRGERPVIDAKYDLLRHPLIRFTEDGGGRAYVTDKDVYSVGSIECILSADAKEYFMKGDTDIEILTDTQTREEAKKGTSYDLIEPKDHGGI